jgi:hypothetical protein
MAVVATACGGDAETLGGSWRLVKAAALPEAGAARRYLYRGNQRVDDFVADSHFYPPDCVVYVTSRMAAAHTVFAVCGAQRPVAIASFESTWWTFGADGIRRRGEFIPIAAIRAVAQQQPPLTDGWQKTASTKPVLTPEETATVPDTDSLVDASSHGNLAEVEQALRGGVDPNVAIDGLTPLIAAAAHGHVDVIRRLAAAGADVNHADEAGRTALMYAARAGEKAAMDALLAAGADAKIRDKEGKSAADYSH